MAAYGNFGKRRTKKIYSLMTNLPEMKVILEAKAEEQEAKDIRAREREEEQEKAKAEVRLAEEHAAKAADSIINADGVDSGRFYLLVDEMPLREPENAENIVIAGNLRGK